MNWYLKVLRNYAVFRGRARRQEFWMFMLVNAILGIVINIVDRTLSDHFLLGTIYRFAVIIPFLAVWTRRVHDTGRPGTWVLLLFVPVVGFVVLTILAVLPGTVGANQYGPDPKESAVAPV